MKSRKLICSMAWACVIIVTLISSASARSRDSFNEGWRFARFGPSPAVKDLWIDEPGAKDAKASPSVVSFDDSAWRKLDVPHDWGIEGPFRYDLDGATGRLQWRGIGWYRKSFSSPQSDKGKRIFLDLDGAMAYAEVWLNGEKVGEWPYGYSSFRVELTKHFKCGAENTIAVRIDTTKWDSRWYPGAGIYRNVWMVKTAPVHVGHWGTYITTPALTDKSGVAKVITTIDNQGSADVSVVEATTIYEVDIHDELGEKVAHQVSPAVKIVAGARGKVISEIAVSNPKRWDIKSPNRYIARTILTVDGRIVDTYDTAFGFRTIRFIAKDGFHLNGRRVQIQGVCLHHDLGPLGAAFNVRAQERQIEIMQEMGVNAIRTSHNPPAPELIELCDKMGVLIQVEAFDCWKRGKRTNDYNKLFEKWHKKDLQAMVWRDCNSPSVFMWSTGNELLELKRGEPDISSKLTAIVKAEDPTRPVQLGSNRRQAGFNGFQNTVDVFGYNYNLGSYRKFLEANPDRPLLGSETSSCVSSRGEYFFPVQGGNVMETRNKADFQISSYDLQYPGWGCTPDRQFEMLAEFPAVLGEFVWTGFDYLGEPTPYNGDSTSLLNFTDPEKLKEFKKQLKELGKIRVPSRSSYFGIVDLCGFKKDRYYSYLSQWRPDYPSAHIFPHWNWPSRIGEKTPVHVYTSGDEAELFVNGESMGRKKRTGYRIQWDDIEYQPGEIKVVAYKQGKEWAKDTVFTTGSATKLDAVADRSEIGADGADLSFITITIQDKDGRMVPRTHNLINFTIEGPAEIIAVGSGNAASHESFKAMKHRAFNGLCLAIVRSYKGEPGKIKVTAESKGLRSISVVIHSK